MISIENRDPTGPVRQADFVIVVILIAVLSLSACGGGSTPKQTLRVFYPGDTAVPVSGPLLPASSHSMRE
jgi:hypothetical protein